MKKKAASEEKTTVKKAAKHLRKESVRRPRRSKKQKSEVDPQNPRRAEERPAQPLQALTEALLRQSENALTNLRVVLDEHADQSAMKTDRVKAWLKSDQAKGLLRETPALKEVFASAAAAAKSLPKAHRASLAAESRRLDDVRKQLADFRETRSQ